MQKENSAGSSLEVLYLELTHDCNFDCIHCGNYHLKHSFMDFSLVQRLLDEFNEINGKKVMLTGGEPLLHPQLEDILKLTATHAYETKLSTNGFLLNQPNFDFVLDYNLAFKLSLDGTREVHNLIRRNPNSYDSLLASMKKISTKKKEIVTRTTVMKNNEESIVDMLFELDRLTKEEGIYLHSAKIWPVRAIGRADHGLMLSPKQYHSFLEKLNNSTRDFKFSFKIIVGPTFGIEQKFKGGPIQYDDIYTCNILHHSIEIAPNGDIYPCSFMRYSFGNVKNFPLKSIFMLEQSMLCRRNVLAKRKVECGNCVFFEQCKGGCIAETYQVLFDSRINKQRFRDVYCFREEGSK